MIVFTKTHTRLNVSDTTIAAGGEGEIHLVEETSVEYSNTCVKIYYKKKLNKLLHSKIEYMVRNQPNRLTSKGYKICWPTETIYNDKKEFIGFLMPLSFSNSIKLTYLTSTKISKKQELLDWRKKFSRDLGAYAFYNRFKLIHNLLLPIYEIHKSKNYVIHDLKPDNILVNSSGKISMIDMDSIQIKNSTVSFPGSAATFEYIPTEFYKIPNASKTLKDQTWDMFAAGVIFYELLFGIHPFLVTAKNSTDEDGISYNIKENLFPFGDNWHKIINRPTPHNYFRKLPNELKELFMRTFSGFPSKRPTAEEWISIIHQIVEDGRGKYLPPEPPEEKPKPDPPIRKDPPKPPEPPNELTSGQIIAIVFGVIFILGILMLFVRFW